MNRIAITIIAAASLIASAFAEDYQRANNFAWGILYPGHGISNAVSLTVNSQDKWVRLHNQSTNRIWLSWTGVTNINPGVITLTQTNSGTTLVIVTNITGCVTNFIGTGGDFIEASATGDGDMLFIENPPAQTLYLMGENVISNAVSYTKGQY